jgi:hypothetical protein
MTLAKRPALPDVRPAAREIDDRTHDDAIKSKLRSAVRDLGFGGLPEGSTADTRRAPARSIQLVVPDYLFEELGMRAVRRRVTKRFLILEALAACGYQIEPADMEEDGRRRR